MSVPWLSGASGNAAALRVFDVRHGRVIPHQLADTDGDGRMDTLLFQSHFRPGTARNFWILNDSSLKAAPSADICFSRPVPERLDDFAWENDLTTHRIYGPTVARPAPEGEGLGRGCGGIAVFRDGKPHVSGNWVSARTLYNGPVQTAFEVVYAPWYMGAVWDKASPVQSAAAWEAEARRVRECIRHPLQVRVR